MSKKVFHLLILGLFYIRFVLAIAGAVVLALDSFRVAANIFLVALFFSFLSDMVSIKYERKARTRK